MTPIVGNALVGPASHVQNNSPDHGRVKVCHLSQNFSTQITSREYFSVFWTDLHPNGPSWGLIEHLGCQSLKERFFRDTLYLLLDSTLTYVYRKTFFLNVLYLSLSLNLSLCS